MQKRSRLLEKKPEGSMSLLLKKHTDILFCWNVFVFAFRRITLDLFFKLTRPPTITLKKMDLSPIGKLQNRSWQYL